MIHRLLENGFAQPLYVEQSPVFIDDLPDGMGAATALCGAAERRIDAAHARPLRGARDRGPDLGVAEDVA